MHRICARAVLACRAHIDQLACRRRCWWAVPLTLEMPSKPRKCVGCNQTMANLSHHLLSTDMCHLTKLCHKCGMAKAPNACSHSMWHRAWATTKKQLHERGEFDETWKQTDQRYLDARECARQLALQRAKRQFARLQQLGTWTAQLLLAFLQRLLQ